MSWVISGNQSTPEEGDTIEVLQDIEVSVQDDADFVDGDWKPLYTAYTVPAGTKGEVVGYDASFGAIPASYAWQVIVQFNGLEYPVELDRFLDTVEPGNYRVIKQGTQ